MTITLLKGDCLKLMGGVKSHSIDLILTDLPFGITDSSWDKIIDFGGEAVEDYTLSTPVSVQSIWCLEKEFPMALNQFIAEKLTAREISDYGLLSLFFSEDDFISWWLPPA